MPGERESAMCSPRESCMPRESGRWRIEPAGCDPRVFKRMALTYAVADRGACGTITIG